MPPGGDAGRGGFVSLKRPGELVSAAITDHIERHHVGPGRIGVIALEELNPLASDMPGVAGTRLTRVDAFVRAHFGVRGSLRLHRAAIGLDLLRAPVNVALAPVFLLSRLAGIAALLLGLKRMAGWLFRQRILLKSNTARAVEAHVKAELLGLPAQTILPGPQQQRLEDYTAVRSAVSEITTTLLVVVSGFALFHSATPGVISLTPLVSGHVAQASAIESFMLGERLGALWYSLFPARLAVWAVVAIGVGLAMAASLVATFAGIIADPVQAALGIHRRRLMRLLSALDAAERTPPSLAREHLLARAADISDAGVSLIRFLRP